MKINVVSLALFTMFSVMVWRPATSMTDGQWFLYGVAALAAVVALASTIAKLARLIWGGPFGGGAGLNVDEEE